MSRVSSLGIHTPAALPYCITEGILPDPPPPKSYTWSHGLPHEELLGTASAVIWSQGGVIRRVFRYDVEKEPVIRAILTWFPSDTPDETFGKKVDGETETDSQDGSYMSGGSEGGKKRKPDWDLDAGEKKKHMATWNSKTRTYGHQLGNFPKIRRGPPANGVDHSEDAVGEEGQGRARALVVFLKTHAFVYFLGGSSYVLNLPFEIQNAAPAPQGLILHRKMENVMDPSDVPNYSFNTFSTRKDCPRLYTLLDPLSEPGQIVTSSNFGVDAAKEDLFYISPQSEIHPRQGEERGREDEPEVIFAITYNSNKQVITLWQCRYIPQESLTSVVDRTPVPSGLQSRRRSSIHLVTGQSTPLAGGGPGAVPLGSQNRGAREPATPVEPCSLTELGDDFAETGARRSSRRISSMVSRTDLAANYDSGRFQDIPQPPSLMTSFGTLASQVPPPVPFNSMAIDEPAPDELLEELSMSALGLGMGSLGLYDSGSEGLRQELLTSKIEKFDFRIDHKNLGRQEHLPRVFTIRAPASVHAAAALVKEPPGKRIIMFIVNRDEGSLLQLTIQIQVHAPLPKGYPRHSSPFAGSLSMEYSVMLSEHNERKNVMDACKVEDGGVERVLILDMDGKLTLYSPFGSPLNIFLPPKLARWNPNVVGEDGSRRGSRKKDFARNLSTNPDIYTRLEYPDVSGRVTVFDGDDVGHRIHITMSPKDLAVRHCLETIQIVLGATLDVACGEGIWTAWMSVSNWLAVMANPEAALDEAASPVDEWKALVIAIFLFAIPHIPEPKPPPRRKSGFARSVSVLADNEWQDMLTRESEHGSGPDFLRSPAWDWLADEQAGASMDASTQAKRQSLRGNTPQEPRMNIIITECIGKAREYLKSAGAEANKSFGQGRELADIGKLCLAICAVALTLVREEWKLDIACEPVSRRMCPVLRQMSTWLGWDEWSEEFMLEDAEMVRFAFDDSKIQSAGVPPQQMSRPDIYIWMMASLRGSSPPPFMTLHDLVVSPNEPASNSQYSDDSQRARNPFSPPPPPAPLPQQKPIFARLTPRTKCIIELYRVLNSPGCSCYDVVSKMVDLKVTLTWLRSLPEGVAVPLREAIAKCQEQPPTTWAIQALDLVGRKDLRMLLDPSACKRVPEQWKTLPSHEASKDITHICNSTLTAETIGTYDHIAEFDRQTIAKLLFNSDKRIAEASRLLQSTKPAFAKCIPNREWNDAEALDAYKEVASNVALRTLAVGPGRGLFNFSARIPLLTERFPVPGYSLTTVIKPAGQTISADKSMYTEEKVCWSFFHAGVAAGLSISREAKEIDSSWIVFNKPSDLTNRHAGFLLGLGLNGHLRNIAKWHAFNYLTPKHTMVSCALLIGLSASWIGTMDMTVVKLLSVHVTKLLPPGSADLNLNTLVQTAGIMGIGLLYADTQHRRMSEVMLSEIEHVEPTDSCVPTDTMRDEGYRLSAGFALGFINLGAGGRLRGMHDMRLVERLLSLAVGPKEVSIVHILDKATAGAVMALTLIYMKTNDEALARKLDVPDTTHLLEYVRPDIFLLRTVGRNLIMWDQIEGSFAWMRKRLRPFHRSRYRLETLKALESEDLPLFNVLAGLCFSIGLRFAGSNSEEIRDLLLHYLDQFIRLCSIPAVNHDQKLTRQTVRNCQDLLALCCATVMAGTGDIPIFRRLRKLHGRTDGEVPFGSHLATHLAIGVLFLGNGAFTFCTTDRAIAGLLAAFYPLFPTSPLDNKAHLQAFRHFWTFAVDPRCLVARDVETMRPVGVPIRVCLKNGKELRKMAPCLLPELASIASITTTSTEHYTVTLDFLANSSHLANFAKNQTIYIHRRSAHASQSTVFQATLQALDEAEADKAPMEWVADLGALRGLVESEKALLLRGEGGGECVDDRLVLEEGLRTGSRERMMGVGMVVASRDGGMWLGEEVRERLRAGVWVDGES